MIFNVSQAKAGARKTTALCICDPTCYSVNGRSVSYRSTQCPFHGECREKLVRDYIPNIMRQNGFIGVFREEVNLSKQYDFLLQKLQEEVDELRGAQNNKEAREEVADILEVLRFLVGYRGDRWGKVEKVCREKRKKRGGFAQFLIWREFA